MVVPTVSGRWDVGPHHTRTRHFVSLSNFWFCTRRTSDYLIVWETTKEATFEISHLALTAHSSTELTIITFSNPSLWSSPAPVSVDGDFSKQKASRLVRVLPVSPVQTVLAGNWVQNCKEQSGINRQAGTVCHDKCHVRESAEWSQSELSPYSHITLIPGGILKTITITAMKRFRLYQVYLCQLV